MNSKSIRLLGAMLFGSVSLVALSAHADEPAGWYVGADGGLDKNDAFRNDLVTANPATRTGNNLIKEKTGWAVGGEVGYNWGNNIRTEFETQYDENSVRRFDGLGAEGHTEGWAGFVNAFYDLDLTQFDIALPIVPYVGAGIGAENWNQTATFPAFAPTVRIRGGSTSFAYQGIGGFAYNIDQNWAATADFRYIVDTKFLGNPRPRFIQNDLSQEQVTLGVRYTFNEPKPAPMAPKAPPAVPAAKPEAAQAPAPSSYLVFFDFNKYNLTSEAQRIVDNAAMNAKGKSGVTHIDVTGHTDAVGSDAYNLKLSKRRADAVKAELVRQGVPASEIMVYAKGKRDPLVPTKDGVREPQNRRVEIVFK